MYIHATQNVKIDLLCTATNAASSSNLAKRFFQLPYESITA